ncbi:MAG: hypothetical protein WCC90_00745 [Methylocella sp.]
MPKEPNGGKIGLGPKPIWGMSVNVAITEPNHSPANQRTNSMPLQFEWEQEATDSVNKHHPVTGSPISRQNFMQNFQKFIDKQVNDQNPEYLKPQNNFSQEWKDSQWCPQGVQASVKIIKTGVNGKVGILKMTFH